VILPRLTRRSVRLALARRRRLAVAGCLAAAVAAAVHALAPAPPPTVPVWVAARDLPAGHLLAARDVAAGAWPPSALPSGVVADPVGATLAGPVRRGEPMTDARLLGAGLLTGQPAGTVAVAVRLADPGGLAGVRSGDRVDVLAGATTGGTVVGTIGGGVDGTVPDGQDELPAPARAVAEAALVLAVPGSSEGPDPPENSGWGALDQGLDGDTLPAGTPGGAGAGGTGGLVLLAVDTATAARLASAQGARVLSLTIRDR
jgi:Flp pilus assembly protein CpaB